MKKMDPKLPAMMKWLPIAGSSFLKNPHKKILADYTSVIETKMNITFLTRVWWIDDDHDGDEEDKDVVVVVVVVVVVLLYYVFFNVYPLLAIFHQTLAPRFTPCPSYSGLLGLGGSCCWRIFGSDGAFGNQEWEGRNTTRSTKEQQNNDLTFHYTSLHIGSMWPVYVACI